MAHGRGGLRAVENQPPHLADVTRQAAYRLLADKPQVLLQEGRGKTADTAYRHALSRREMIFIYSPAESEVMTNENNDVFTMEDEPLATAVQNMRKGSKWLSAFLESYRQPLDGERYLTDREVAELLRVSRRTLQEYRNNRLLPFILLGGKVLYPESGLRELLEANYRKPLE